MLEQERFIHRPNYFDVLTFLEYQEKVMQRHNKTLERNWAHLRHLLNWSLDIPLVDSYKIKPAYSNYLAKLVSDKSKKPLSPASLQRACGEARRFFSWARLHKPRYKRLPDYWIETIQPPRDRGIQSELQNREYYSIEEIRKLTKLSNERLIDKRDQAAVAFLFLTGVRIGAFVTLPLDCVDLEDQTIYQLPSEGVETKNSKAQKTYILQIEDLLEIINKWDEFIRDELGEKALWYPNLKRDGNDWILGKVGKVDSRRMAFSRGLKRMCNQARIKYKSPHKIRHGYGVYGVQHARTIREIEAISQNMGHETLEITLRYYAKQSREDVKHLITGLSVDKGTKFEDELTREFDLFKKWQRSNSI